MFINKQYYCCLIKHLFGSVMLGLIRGGYHEWMEAGWK